MTSRSWAATVRLVHERANHCCEYCWTSQLIIAQSMHVDHIDPQAGDSLDNLGLACPNCNQSKSEFTSGIDPETNVTLALFHPRLQDWDEHFEWVEGGLRIRGRTPTGRATVNRLKINQDRVVIARSLWIRAGLHPPKR